DIVRVTALPINVPFPTRESFIVVDSLHRLIHSLSVETEKDTLYLRTANLVVAICLCTGQIVFKDKNGQTILGERKRGSNSFRPASYNGDSFYALEQGFEIENNAGLDCSGG